MKAMVKAGKSTEEDDAEHDVVQVLAHFKQNKKLIKQVLHLLNKDLVSKMLEDEFRHQLPDKCKTYGRVAVKVIKKIFVKAAPLVFSMEKLNFISTLNQLQPIFYRCTLTYKDITDCDILHIPRTT